MRRLDGARFEGVPHGLGKEAQRDPGPARVEGQEEPAPAAAEHEPRVGRQPEKVARLELHAHEHHLPRVLELGALAEGLEERGQDHRRAVLGAGQGEQRVGPIAERSRRRNVHEMADEGEDDSDAPDAVLRGRVANQAARKGHDVTPPRQPEADPVEDSTACPGMMEKDSERALVQARSSSRPSRMLFRTAGSMSRTWRA